MQPMRLLVIDDDTAACDYLSDLLRYVGLEPVFAHSWDEGLSIMDERPVDVVLIDEAIAHRQGEFFIAGMREHGYPQQVVIMSSMAEYLLVDWVERGASDVLAKPSSPGELKAALTQAYRLMLVRLHRE